MRPKWIKLRAWVKVSLGTLSGTTLVVAVSIAVIVLIAQHLGIGAPCVLCNDKVISNPEVKEPVEFLYLDTTRVASYLAQVQNGALEDKKVTNKVKGSVRANINAAETIEAGVSEEQEEDEEQDVKPTDASRFLELVSALKGVDEGLEMPIEEGEQPQEGQFVAFPRLHVFTPAYLKPYLIARRAEALRAAFDTRKGRSFIDVPASPAAESDSSAGWAKNPGPC